MTWEEKFRAMHALDVWNTRITLNAYGQWMCDPPGEISNGVTLTSVAGHGNSIEAAVEQPWDRMVTDLKEDERVVLRSHTPERRAVKWNGFMWADFPEPERIDAR